MEKQDLSCTWRDGDDCADCNLNSRLGCRYSRRDFWSFTLNQVPFFVMALVCLVLTALISGQWWALIIYLVIVLAFFGAGIETRILCCHCPYWANGATRLNCWAYPNTPKFWKYRPGPMNKAEKALLICFFLIILLLPVVTMIYGIWLVIVLSIQPQQLILFSAIAIAAGTTLTGLQFFYIMQHYFCSKCVNFSCPLNRVSGDIVRAYLGKNPVMKDAWQKTADN
ncbi:MAG: hypothetical protein JXA01_06335 [Dehalococcoidia bacterium]|nr:hypothetical protein [Dehalococcoidia bacterium]